MLKRRWIRIREFGWVLVGAWQVVSLLSEFVFVAGLESRPVRIAGKVLGLIGLVLVAYGFERIMRIDIEAATRAGITHGSHAARPP